MIIRKAEIKDIPAIDDTYTELLTYEQQHGTTTNWALGVYPTAAVPQEKIPQGTMFVLEDEGKICASMVLNQEQAKEYFDIPWLYPAEAQAVYVIHTLTVPPSAKGRGYGSAMIDFAKDYARGQARRYCALTHGCIMSLQKNSIPETAFASRVRRSACIRDLSKASLSILNTNYNKILRFR